MPNLPKWIRFLWFQIGCCHEKLMVWCLRSIQELREHLDRIDSSACWSWNVGTGLAQMLSNGRIIQICSRDLRSILRVGVVVLQVLGLTIFWNNEWSCDLTEIWHIFVPDWQDSWHKELNEAQDRALESWVDLAWRLGQDFTAQYRLKKHVRHVAVSSFFSG